MAQKITLLHQITGTTKLAYALLLDLREFGKQHPFMKEVRILTSKEAKQVRYAVEEETYLFGFLKIRPRYEADVIEVEVGKHIRYLSDVQGGLKLQIDFYFEKQTDNSLLIKEEVAVKGNILFNRLFINILRKAHITTFQHIQKYCEA